MGQPDEPWSSPAACQYEKAVSLGVMSKAFGMPGLRLGWIACQNKEMLLKFKQYKDYLSICNSAPSECLTKIALKNKTKILTENNNVVRQNLATLERVMAQYDSLFSWYRAQGGCVALVRYHGKEIIDSLCHRLVETSGVLLMPASVYTQTPWKCSF